MNKYKNVTLLIILIVVSIVGCIYALKWHAVYQADRLNTTIITDYIHELKKEEFMNYISDNPYAVIYFGITSDDNCRRFENKFKNYIINNNLKETIVYVNVNELAGPELSTKLDNLYNVNTLRQENKYFKTVPTVAVYNHTTLVDFVSDGNLTVEMVRDLLLKYNIDGE